MSILVIGDSHSVIWEGSNVRNRNPNPSFENVKVHHLDAPLAYNLISADGVNLGKWGHESFRIVRAEIEAQRKPQYVMLSFGEIDIRTQVFSRAINNGTSLQVETDVIAARLLHFSHQLFNEFQIPILIWSAVPTSRSTKEVWNPSFPCIGTERERNYCTKHLEVTLQNETEISRSQGREIYSFGAFDALTDQGNTNVNFQEDGCHLNWQGLKVGIQALMQLCREHKLNAHSYFTTRHSETDILGRHQIRMEPETNITPNNDVDLEYAWLSFDIGYGAIIETIELEFSENFIPNCSDVRLHCGNIKASIASVNFQWKSTPGCMTLMLQKKPSSAFRFLKVGMQMKDANELCLLNANSLRFDVRVSG